MKLTKLLIPFLLVSTTCISQSTISPTLTVIAGTGTQGNSGDRVYEFINTAYSDSSTTITYNSANNGGYTIVAGDRIQFDYSY
jgi:hypothetical protein